jgi:MYXO-CTERM domain-containing protein
MTQGVFIDGFIDSLPTGVAEPGSLAVVAAGLAGFLVLQRRRRNRA